MPEQNHHNVFEGAERMARMWNDFAGRIAAAGLGVTPDQTPPEAARAVRDAMLSAMGDATDQYLRTPEFRELMKQSLQQSVQFRQQVNEFLGRMQHDLQGASRQDMDQLMLGLTHIETRLVNSMERMSERLDDLASRLDALERNAGARRKPAAKAKSKRTNKPTASQKTATKAAAKKKTGKKKSKATRRK